MLKQFESNTVLINITSNLDKVMRGNIYSEYYDKTEEFFGVIVMIDIMEALFDNLQFPQSTTQYRQFKGKKDKSNYVRRIGEKMENNSLKDEKASFLVHVQYRQNATWQGSVTWVNENKVKNFRSTFELLQLMDEAVVGQDNKEKLTWEE